MDRVKRRIYDIIQIGNKTDVPSTLFDYFIVVVILINLVVTFMSTFETFDSCKSILESIEFITIIIFAVEYVLRLFTAECLYPQKSKKVALFTFIFSLYGLIDLFSFLPYFMPIFFPSGVVAFRMFRVIRIFRLFKLNAQYDAFHVVLQVLKEKQAQLLSSMALIFIIMLAASLSMYSLEHDAQPEAFKNAFSGMWWSVSAMLTVGYGDIYPITPLGQMLAIVIAFLGVAMVALPTGIISAGFVEIYSRDNQKERNVRIGAEDMSGMMVTSLRVDKDSPLKDHYAKDIDLKSGETLLLVKRDKEKITPNNSLIIKEGDEIIIMQEG